MKSPSGDTLAIAEGLPVGTRVRLTSGREGVLVGCGFSWASIRYDGGALDQIAPSAEVEIVARPPEARDEEDRTALPAPGSAPSATLPDSSGNGAPRGIATATTRNAGETNDPTTPGPRYATSVS